MMEAPWHLLGLPRDVATEFLGVFARFEYALKAAGFVTGTPQRVKPDWVRFGASVGAAFDGHAPTALDEAVSYLLQRPPQVQALQGTTLSWTAPQFDAGASELERLLSCVRIVRNNLFHGGKFFPNPNDPTRDALLVEFSLRILEAVLPLDTGVAGAFQG